MFNPSREEVRRFFSETWRKYRAGVALEGLEATALEAILLHPEYHGMLERPEPHLDRDYSPEGGQLNPFLHLSLHLAVAEQLSIDQPRGITGLFERLAAARGSRHDALHVVLECLGETVWLAQRDRTAPDEAAYLERISRAIG
jgi:hypothetical protein